MDQSQNFNVQPKSSSFLSKLTKNKSFRVLATVFAVVVVAGVGYHLRTIGDASAIGTNVLVDVYGDTSVSSTLNSEPDFVGRLYTDGTLFCTTNPNRSQGELQKYKVITLGDKLKTQLTKTVDQKDLLPSPDSDTENFDKLSSDTPQVVTRRNGELAINSTSSDRKQSKKKDKALDVDKLVRSNCKKAGQEYIPDSITYTVEKSTAVKTAPVWPSSLPTIKSDTQITVDNLTQIKSSLGASNQTNADAQAFLVSNGIVAPSDLTKYTDKTLNKDQSTQLYALALANKSQSEFYVSSNGAVYKITIAIDLPAETEPSEVQPNQSQTVSLMDRVFPTAHAAYNSSARKYRIKVLITDENRNSKPSLVPTYMEAQLTQLFWHGQAQARIPNVSDISYYITPPGTKATAFCGSGGVKACNVSAVLNKMFEDKNLFVANTYTELIVPVIAGANGYCGVAKIGVSPTTSGSVATVLDTSSDYCKPKSDLGARAFVIAHEFFHMAGFPHEKSSTTLMGVQPGCLSYTIFSCQLSRAQRTIINTGNTYGLAFRRKSLPDYNCPIAFGVVYPTVRRGSTGDCVRMLQWRLDNLNNGTSSNLTITGKFDATTENAVRSLQSLGALPVTGVVDGNTWSMFNALSS